MSIVQGSADSREAKRRVFGNQSYGAIMLKWRFFAFYTNEENYQTQLSWEQVFSVVLLKKSTKQLQSPKKNCIFLQKFPKKC